MATPNNPRPITHEERDRLLRIQMLRSAISHNRCILRERRYTVESHQLAQSDIAKYEAEIAALPELAA